MTRRTGAVVVMLLTLAASRAGAEPVMFTYEGTISSSFSGLLGALGINPADRVVFSFIVERESSDPLRTAPAYAHRDVLASMVTIGDYSMRGKSGLTQIFNGPLGSVDYDQFYAYSDWRGEAVAFDGRWLQPRQAYLTLQGHAQVFDSGAYPLTAPDPGLFGIHRLQLSYAWADDPSSGVAITVNVDRASTTPISVPEPGTMLLVGVGAIGWFLRRRSTRSLIVVPISVCPHSRPDRPHRE
ncbi:MAG: PEP-CTERM sorting domain-containing protein [Vicinamibacterales bacterium]